MKTLVRDRWVDYAKLWGLYLACVVVVYAFPAFVKYPFFVLLLLAGFNSKDNVFVLAFFVILFAQIGGLFPETSRVEGAYQRLPVYGFGFLRMPLYDLSVFMLSAKAFRKGKREQSNFWGLTFIGVLSVVILYSVILGMSVGGIRDTIRSLVSMLNLFLFARLITTESQLVRFFSLIFSAILVSALAAVLEATTGFKLGNIAGIVYRSALDAPSIRITGSAWLTILGYIFAIFWFYKKKASGFGRLYLGVIITICFALRVLAATRGWFLAFSFILIASLVLYPAKLYRAASYVVPVVFVLILAVTSSKQLTFVVNNVMGRLATIEEFAEGDIDAGGTLSRYSRRLPRMMEKVRENPIMGFGFSDEYYAYADNHVGWAMQLLQTGIWGITLFLLWVYFFFLYNYKVVKKTGERAFYVFTVGVMGLLIIHSGSTAVFAFSALGYQQEIYEMLAIIITGRNLLAQDEYANSNRAYIERIA